MVKYIKRGFPVRGQTNYNIQRGNSRNISITRYSTFNIEMLRQTEMRAATLAFVLLLVMICFTRIGSSQVTFSRDWNPGKRSSATGEGNCAANVKSMSTVCHMLMNELRELSVCQARAVVNFLRTEDDTPSDQGVFSGGR